MSVTETTLDIPEGLRLQVRVTRPGGEPRGIIVLVHGLGEHCGRYDHVAGPLAEDGFVVFAYDQRGHGRSTGLRGHVDGFRQYTDDLQLAMDAARGEFGEELPVLVYGHSMGGLVVLSYFLDRPDTPAVGFAVSNPLIRPAFEPPRLKVAAGRFLSRFLPRLRLANEVDSNGISRDPAEVKAYNEDPYVHGLVSTRWFTSMTAAAERVEAEAEKLGRPGLWILSGADPVVDSTAGEAVARKTSGADIKAYPESVHEPHNDLDRDQVIADLRAWMGARLASA